MIHGLQGQNCLDLHPCFVYNSSITYWGRTMTYTTLNDAATIHNAFSEGNVKVYYKKFDYGVGGGPAIKEMIIQNCVRGASAMKKCFGDYASDFVKLYIEQTHVCLGEIKGTDNIDDLSFLLQGEIWSPEGEARNLIRNKNLCHTSISIGDMIETEDGDLYLLSFSGFEKL